MSFTGSLYLFLPQKSQDKLRVIGKSHSVKEILKNAVSVMSPRKDGDYQKGVAGFSAWAAMLSDNKTCSTDNDSIRFEHMLCEDDATTCLIDGRGCAAESFKKLAEKEAGSVDVKTPEKYRSLAELFSKTKTLAEQTWSLPGGWDNMEQRPAKLAEKEVREKACEYIKQIEVLEKQSLAILQELV